KPLLLAVGQVLGQFLRAVREANVLQRAVADPVRLATAPGARIGGEPYVLSNRKVTEDARHLQLDADPCADPPRRLPACDVLATIEDRPRVRPVTPNEHVEV